jgi:hypothetical protein
MHVQEPRDLDDWRSASSLGRDETLPARTPLRPHAESSVDQRESKKVTPRMTRPSR